MSITLSLSKMMNSGSKLVLKTSLTASVRVSILSLNDLSVDLSMTYQLNYDGWLTQLINLISLMSQARMGRKNFSKLEDYSSTGYRAITAAR